MLKVYMYNFKIIGKFLHVPSSPQRSKFQQFFTDNLHIFHEQIQIGKYAWNTIGRIIHAA